MWLLSSQWLSDGILVVPWVEWLLEGMSVAWPWLGQQPEMRLMLLSGEGVGQGLRDWVSLGQGAGGVKGLGLLMGCVVQGQGHAESQAEVLLSQIEVKGVVGQTATVGGLV